MSSAHGLGHATLKGTQTGLLRAVHRTVSAESSNALLSLPCEQQSTHMIIWGGYHFLLDACLRKSLAQLLNLQLLVPEPALQIHCPPLKVNQYIY